MGCTEGQLPRPRFKPPCIVSRHNNMNQANSKGHLDVYTTSANINNDAPSVTHHTCHMRLIYKHCKRYNVAKYNCVFH